MRSDYLLESYKAKFSKICNLPSSTDTERAEFLRNYLAVLNELFFELRPSTEIDELNAPDENHSNWKRLTPFLAIWDDYAKQVLGFTYDQGQIEKLAKVFVDIFSNNPSFRCEPKLLEAIS